MAEKDRPERRSPFAGIVRIRSWGSPFSLPAVRLLSLSVATPRVSPGGSFGLAPSLTSQACSCCAASLRLPRAERPGLCKRAERRLPRPRSRSPRGHGGPDRVGRPGQLGQRSACDALKGQRLLVQCGSVTGQSASQAASRWRSSARWVRLDLATPGQPVPPGHRHRRPFGRRKPCHPLVEAHTRWPVPVAPAVPWPVTAPAVPHCRASLTALR